MNNNIIVNNMIAEYLKSLNSKEKKAYEIAKDHMGCLLDISRTNGYLKWLEKQSNK